MADEMTRIQSSTVLVAALLTGIAISSPAGAQEYWDSSLVGYNTPINGALSDPMDMECDDEFYRNLVDGTPGIRHAVGVKVRSDQLVDSVSLMCAVIAADGDHVEVYTYSGFSGGAGGFGGQERDYLCRDGEVLAGFRGRAGDYIDQLQVACRPVAGGSLRWLPAAGGTGGTAFSAVSCPAGMAVDVMRVWAGQVYAPYVAKFTFRCQILPKLESLPLQQIGGQLVVAPEADPEPTQDPFPSQVADVVIGDAPEENPEEDPAPASDPIPATEDETPADAVPEPDPAPTTRPSPRPGLAPPSVDVPVRSPLPRPGTPVADAPEPDPESEPDAADEDIAVPEPAPLQMQLSLSPPSVVGDRGARLTIKLSEPAATDVRIILASGLPELVQVPEDVSISAGSRQARVEVATTGDVDDPTTVPIHATFSDRPDESPAQVNLLVRPDPSADKERGRGKSGGQGRGNQP
ncbi:MAG: hypothetical protein ACRDIZ_11760 [Actinomycetota bacterium]